MKMDLAAFDSADRPDPASYRDPAGHVFQREGIVYRQVNPLAKEDFETLMDSGAYDLFTRKGWLIPHTDVTADLSSTAGYVIRPVQIPLISYPFEWSFSMLKDAALLTLKLAMESMRFGLMLKDATPFNVQWLGGKLVFIDTLSFERYDGRLPWIAYRQFCECFLGPLLLMSYTKQPLQQLMLAWPEGIPVNVVRSLLPWRAKFSLPVYLHIFLHAKVAVKSAAGQAAAGDSAADAQTTGDKSSTQQRFTPTRLSNLLTSLHSLIDKLAMPETKGNWLGYYDEAAERDTYLEPKKRLIDEWIQSLPKTKLVADLGANEGVFAKIAASLNKRVIAVDLDPFCIERLYKSRNNKEDILPLVIDLQHPSPSIGFNNAERPAFNERCRPDLVLALALIHHLAIGSNIPMDKIASFFAEMAGFLIIEWVPPGDEKARVLMSHKSIDYPHYTHDETLAVFKKYFDLLKTEPVGNSGRICWMLRRIRPTPTPAPGSSS